MSAIWLLTATFYLKDVGRQVYKQDYVKQEYCLQAAKTQWKNFYKNEMDVKGNNMEVFCNEKKNSYNFVQVSCTKEGLCNI